MRWIGKELTEGVALLLEGVSPFLLFLSYFPLVGWWVERVLMICEAGGVGILRYVFSVGIGEGWGLCANMDNSYEHRSVHEPAIVYVFSSADVFVVVVDADGLQQIRWFVYGGYG
jgi:hypothetical protein